ncbi:GNAT family N-acetyltransferase [Mycoplasma marinum]|uniref:N-acetyltransferase domain-containing protein n=1 Tax=Mycoplasma marinum TaxID=1937190 RepID=A0A4R0XK10_9MOLU|nr:GNAT family N-acetyltransferase [Mycoplasma marinum]TCG10986.1 hypothetical protein C4B24_03425 [Mycoplasma marinum]
MNISIIKKENIDPIRGRDIIRFAIKQNHAIVGNVKIRKWFRGDRKKQEVAIMDSIEIARIEINKKYRKKGVGTEVLNLICNDKFPKKVIWLQAKRGRINFFKKRGFIELQAGPSPYIEKMDDTTYMQKGGEARAIKIY